MTVGIVRTNWSGTSGGPGLTQLAMIAGGGGSWSAANAQSAVDAVRTFWDSIKANLPNELQLSVQASVDQYAETTGELTETVTAGTAPLPVVGTSASVYAGGCGFKITWETASIRNGRRVRGRTYVVPCASSMFEADGTLNSAQVTAITTAANTMRSTLSSAGVGLVVWSRPSQPGATDGAITGVQSVVIKDKTAILRGRRD